MADDRDSKNKINKNARYPAGQMNMGVIITVLVIVASLVILALYFLTR